MCNNNNNNNDEDKLLLNFDNSLFFDSRNNRRSYLQILPFYCSSDSYWFNYWLDFSQSRYLDRKDKKSHYSIVEICYDFTFHTSLTYTDLLKSSFVKTLKCGFCKRTNNLILYGKIIYFKTQSRLCFCKDAGCVDKYLTSHPQIDPFNPSNDYNLFLDLVRQHCKRTIIRTSNAYNSYFDYLYERLFLKLSFKKQCKLNHYTLMSGKTKQTNT